MVSKELRQLHNRKAMVQIRKEDLTTGDRQKEKRDGAVKARGCADGIPQWQYTDKEDASCPMTGGYDDFMLH